MRDCFSEAILRLAASQDERARIGKLGKEQVMERFMVQKTWGKACAHLAQIVAERTRIKKPTSEEYQARRCWQTLTATVNSC